MKDKLKSSDSNPRKEVNEFLRTLAITIMCVFLDFLFIVVIAFLSAGIADRAYNTNHSITSPVERGDDFGLGLVVIVWAGLSLLFSIPFVIATYKKLFALILKIWSGK